ncbi:uncharacterized protein SPPG_03858 [Spizellomyces punctatus DAOM BR117]|uniref:Uncharacterized protein n=1 Tax=Spizellomyces punctatus (strain DAOM BR117) TaxID=645134 RepID=A0A0L0HI16_SPIPD|nr:uncharacterized protein SPPG_03858 [Spizellomyces punctatus DAOM BR117]KND00742.1 hypothetical protein SPPG_03858 [Spizellomyces punctatus DAOM BR117]|eukprot:XP_016608781.1 hypothetical protein SPPG_03858 [Spizellomyces punctatus DAOM BR117]
MSDAPVLNDYVFGITCVVIAVCLENQGRIMTTFKRWNTPLFYLLTVQNVGTFFHAWMFLRVWNFGYVEDVAFNFFDGFAYILMVNLSGWIHYDRLKMLFYRSFFLDPAFPFLLILEFAVLSVDTGLFQGLYKGKISPDVTSVSGPVTAFYYIVLEVLMGIRLIYNLMKTTGARDFTSFINECKLSVLFFLCTDLIYIITMFTASPGIFVSVKTLCYALKLKYTLLMYDDVKTQIIQKNKSSQKSGSNHGKASDIPSATNVINTTSMC